jgi:hypothetical protein
MFGCSANANQGGLGSAKMVAIWFEKVQILHE